MSLFKHNIFLAVGQLKAGNCGAIDILISVIKENIDDEGVCGYGCAAIRNITESGKGRNIK